MVSIWGSTSRVFLQWHSVGKLRVPNGSIFTSNDYEIASRKRAHRISTSVDRSETPIDSQRSQNQSNFRSDARNKVATRASHSDTHSISQCVLPIRCERGHQRRAAADDGDGAGVCRARIWSLRVLARPAAGGLTDRFRGERSVRSDFGARVG